MIFNLKFVVVTGLEPMMLLFHTSTWLTTIEKEKRNYILNFPHKLGNELESEHRSDITSVKQQLSEQFPHFSNRDLTQTNAIRLFTFTGDEVISWLHPFGAVSL
jgi:Zn-dependent oligopeptidase